jgi:hypothetical protein
VSVTVSAALAGSNPWASTATIHLAKTMPAMVMAPRTMTVRVATLLASRQAD